MGKENFRSYEEVCKRLAALENQVADLKKENQMLRSRSNLGHERTVLVDICNTEKAKKLFAVAPKNGELVHDENAVKGNFSVFYQNIFRALQPSVREYKGNYSLKMQNISGLTEDEYKIYLETLDACIETIYYAKQKLEKEN